jgi:hypothetical protein
MYTDLLAKIILARLLKIDKLEASIRTHVFPLFTWQVKVWRGRLWHRDCKTHLVATKAACAFYGIGNSLHCIFYCGEIGLCNRLPEAVYPCAERCDHFASFGCGKGGAPFCYVGDLINPYWECGGVVFGFEKPFVGEAGGGA